MEKTPKKFSMIWESHATVAEECSYPTLKYGKQGGRRVAWSILPAIEGSFHKSFHKEKRGK